MEAHADPLTLDRAQRERLQHARILIVGAGGLGAPAALHLAAAGVGTLGLMDGDAVELSNLHRQIVYRTADLGHPKVHAAARRIAALNPSMSIECFDQHLTADNLGEFFRRFDFVIDGTDRVATKYLVNDGAVRHRVPFSHAGILGFQGQALTVLPGKSACLRCLFPSPPSEDEIPTCQEAGVIGALAGSIGVVQATEAIKFLLDLGTLLADRLLTYDALAVRWRTISLSRNRSCAVCGDHPSADELAPVVFAHRDCE